MATKSTAATASRVIVIVFSEEKRCGNVRGRGFGLAPLLFKSCPVIPKAARQSEPKRPLPGKANERTGEERDKKGISVEVFRGESYTEEEIIEAVIAKKNKCRGVGRLMVGAVRDIRTTPQLDVVQDAKNHANIEGLPEYGKDVGRAERLATQLAKLTRPLWIQPKPTA